MEMIERFYNTYDYVMKEKIDPRTSDWFLVSSPLPTYLAVCSYLLIVWYGPRYMDKREPFKLTTVLIVYNMALIIWSAYMFWEFFATTVLNPEFNLTCQAIDYSEDPQSVRLARVTWMFFLSKLIEFADSFFFILRKKNNQLTFLHVYHHSTMPLLWWLGARFVPGGNSYLCAMINTFIHTLMYSYYGLAAVGPSMQKYLWWKKYMTSLQLIQFWSGLFHAIYALRLDCGFPRPYLYAVLVYLMSHIVLFSNFYMKSYSTKNVSSHTKFITRDQDSNITSKKTE